MDTENDILKHSDKIEISCTYLDWSEVNCLPLSFQRFTDWQKNEYLCLL